MLVKTDPLLGLFEDSNQSKQVLFFNHCTYSLKKRINLLKHGRYSPRKKVKDLCLLAIVSMID